MNGAVRSTTLAVLLGLLTAAGWWFFSASPTARRTQRRDLAAVLNDSVTIRIANDTDSPTVPLELMHTSEFGLGVVEAIIGGHWPPVNMFRNDSTDYTATSHCGRGRAVDCLKSRLQADSRTAADLLNASVIAATRSLASNRSHVQQTTLPLPDGACILNWCCGGEGNGKPLSVLAGCQPPSGAGEAVVELLQPSAALFCRASKKTAACFNVTWRSRGYAAAGPLAASQHDDPYPPHLAFFTDVRCHRGPCGSLLMFGPMYSAAWNGAPVNDGRVPGTEGRPQFKRLLSHSVAIGCRRESVARLRRAAWNPDIGPLTLNDADANRLYWEQRQRDLVGACVPATSDVASVDLRKGATTPCAVNPPDAQSPGQRRRYREKWHSSKLASGLEPSLEAATTVVVGLGVGNPFDSCDVSATFGGGANGAAVVLLLPKARTNDDFSERMSSDDAGVGIELVTSHAGLFQPWQHFVPLAGDDLPKQLKVLMRDANEQLELVARNMVHVAGVVLQEPFRVAYHACLLALLTMQSSSAKVDLTAPRTSSAE